MSNLYEKIAELSPEKRELLLSKLKEKQGNAIATEIRHQSRESNTFPLSFAQQRLWFFNQLEPDSCAYNISSAVRLTGKLDISAFSQSIQEILQRHEALRTNFQMRDGQPVQIINPTANFTLPLIDWQFLSQTEREQETLKLLTAESQRPFDLDTGSLLRVTLLRFSEIEHVVLLTMHHIIADGWSMGVLISELVALYPAFACGKISPLPKLPIQYADFAVWQRQWLQGKVMAQQLAYWQQQLGGILPILELPSDRPRPAIQTDKGATQSLLISKSVSQGLRSLSQQQGVSLFMTLLAAFQVLLYRYTQQDDIIVGTPIANRNRSEIEGLIGFFVNTLVLRTYLGDNPSFLELLTRVRDVTLGAYANQDLPFEQLVEELRPERDLSHSSLFQVMFILQNAPMGVLELPGLTLQSLEIKTNTANFDLTLSMAETPAGLEALFEYNTDLFDAARIERMLGHFQTLLAAIATRPHQRLSELSILTTNEQQQLWSWNCNQLLFPQHLCIHQLFEVQVERTPDAVAVVWGDEQLTYQELNTQANQLARYLQKQGVSPGILVGICGEPSLELIVGLLAILKAGGAYLPLDPSYPQERLAWMLTDAQISVLLTQERLLTSLPTHQAKIICWDKDRDAIALSSQENLANRNYPENLAYVIYTSGSTGRSKGVMVEHRHLVNAYFAWEESYKLEKVTCHLQRANFSFDVFAGDLVRALCSGSKLVLCPREFLLEPQKLYELMQQEKVDCAEFVPVVLRNLIQYLKQTQQRLNFMQLLICGSDSWYVQEYQEIRNFCGTKTRLINSFGLTEATIDSSYFEILENNLINNSENNLKNNLNIEQLVPIGQPFANTQIYILDSHLQQTPVRVTGEIYISGAGVTRGYLNRPDLTAEKFIPNLFSDKPGERLYKTADLGRYLPDGNIELLGRSDHQVKIRGFRIELGEIEAVLGQHPDVQQAVALVAEKADDKRLIAYVVPHSQNLKSSDLQDFLQHRLPSYMIPSAVMQLESLPITPNGKVDRSALAKLPIIRSEIADNFVAPQTAIQQNLTNIWMEILGVTKIGIHDNFFELGGHSLLTTRLIVKIREAFQIDLPLRILFESPTVESLANTLENMLLANTSTIVQQINIIDFAAEAVLDSIIVPELNPVTATKEPNSILLTGSTGFLGAFLLYELLQQTPADIYCLVRAANLETAKNKLQNSLESYLIWHESFSQRIIPVLGDLSQPLLGISENEFQKLAEKIDLIYHNGAWVHHLYPYYVLKAANVLGTQEVLRLACRVKLKPVHFISTSSIFSVSGISGVKVVKEDDDLDDYQIPDNGYVQTKWVGEKLVKTAGLRGLPVYIYRIGRVSGHSETGVFNINDFLYRLIIGCIQLGIAPDIDIMEDIMPVDYTSKSIIHLSRQKANSGKVFHLVNSQLLHTNMLFNVINSCGYQLKIASGDEWRSQLSKIANSSPEHPLYPLVPFFLTKQSEEKTSQSGNLQFDCQNTLNGLTDTSLVCPSIDEKLLKTYLSYLIKQGFLDSQSK
jgi:amino acid adenylation domain-containing protein/thioester reductase-like protein